MSSDCFFTAPWSAECSYAKSPICLSVWSVPLLYPDYIVLNFEKNYAKIGLGFSLLGGKEAVICSKGIIKIFQME